MNRDYFKRPIQSDRNLHDYGNSKLQRDPEHTWGNLLLGTGLLILLFVAATFAVAAIGGAR